VKNFHEDFPPLKKDENLEFLDDYNYLHILGGYLTSPFDGYNAYTSDRIKISAQV
jgi:hypothetical protein